MVRLQKIAYERMFNTRMLGRARVISSPRKWHAVNPPEQMALNSYKWVNSIVGRIFKPIINWFVEFEMRWQQDIFLQQGLAFQDKYLHEDTELRRDVLFEHMARESLHPYQVVLKGKRRERYYKVERALRGFFVPQYIRAEAEAQTLTTALKLREQWDYFMHANFWSDMTPKGRGTVVPKMIPLQWFMLNGAMTQQAWDQYFYNEKNTAYYTEKELQNVRDHKRFPYDLTTRQGKQDFEEWITKFNERNPGIAVPVGQKLDFKGYYAQIGV